MASLSSDADEITVLASGEIAKRPGVLKYQQLTRTLHEQIRSGQLKPGDMLPPEVDLARQTRLARNTVRQALHELEAEGLIRRVRGKGTIVCEIARTRQEVRGLIGLALPELRAAMYQSLQAGLNSAMTEAAVSMVVSDSDQDLYRQVDQLLRFGHQGVDGVIMVPITTARTPAHHLTFLQERGVPLVFCHRRVEGVNAPMVGFSSYEMGRVAGRELVRLGHRRAAMIFSHKAASCEERRRGLSEALKKVDGEVPEAFVHYDQSIRADALPDGIEDRLTQRLRAMLDDADPPTAVVVSADNLAAVTCRVLQSMGVDVPGDLSVIGFGDRANRQTFLPLPLTSVTVDEYRLGQIAYQTLSEIQSGDRPADDDETILMPLEVSQGETTMQLTN